MDNFIVTRNHFRPLSTDQLAVLMFLTVDWQEHQDTERGGACRDQLMDLSNEWGIVEIKSDELTFEFPEYDVWRVKENGKVIEETE